MEILLVGMKKRTITGIRSAILLKEESLRTLDFSFENFEKSFDYSLKIDNLVIFEVCYSNFHYIFNYAKEISLKHPKLKIIFICNESLIAWKEKCDRNKIFLVCKKDYEPMVKEITKIYRNEIINEIISEENLERLTSMEIKILTLLSKDYSKKEISSILQISKKTVYNHFQNIYHKLNVSSTSGALVRAIELGYISIYYEIV